MKALRIACRAAALLDIEKMHPFQGNLKSLSKDQYEQLRAEIETTGFAFPIHLWEAPDGLAYILGGHQRHRVLTTMRAEGWKVPEIPVVYVEAETFADAKRRVLQDVSQYGHVEGQGLYEFMGEAGIAIGDLMADFKIPDMNMDDFKTEYFEDNTVPPGPDPGAGGLPTEPKTRKGDLWTLNDSRLLCGDSVLIDDVEKLLGGARADLIFTDPPWNVNYGADMDENNAQGYRPRTIMNDSMKPEDWLKFCRALTGTLFIASKPGCPIYLVMSAQEWPIIDGALRDAGFHWSSTIIWAKDRLVMSRKDYHTQYEPIWYGWNETGPRLSPLEDRCQSDLWAIDRPSKSELHPTTKPIELVERAIANSSKKGDLVLDLFGGSGSTLIAATKVGRRSCLMELDPKYCDVILKRWAEMTGGDPVRDDGALFSSLK